MEVLHAHRNRVSSGIHATRQYAAKAETATKGEVKVMRKPDRIGEASRQIRSIARNTVGEGIREWGAH